MSLPQELNDWQHHADPSHADAARTTPSAPATDWRAIPELTGVLDMLLAGQREALGDNLVALYLSGSLATGDFDPNTSDIDFMAVTRGEVNGEEFERLSAMHRELFDSGGHWAGELDGAYFAQAAARRHEVPQASHPFLERGERELRREPLDADWLVHRYIVQRCGVALSGPLPSELIDPVSPDELRQAVRALLSGWWTDMHGRNQHILEHLGYRYYAVQTMCRALQTLATGVLSSKREAAQWGLTVLPGRFHDLIHASLAWPREEHPGSHSLTMELIEYVTGLAAGPRSVARRAVE